MQKAPQASVEVQASAAEAKAQDTSKLLASFGGFNAIRGFLPDADNLNPARKAAKNVFLTDKRFADKRETLKNDIKGWLALLDEGHGTATEFAASCKEKEEKYTAVLKQGITDALYATQNLERSYRELDSFFKTANTDKVKNLRIINVVKDDGSSLENTDTVSFNTGWRFWWNNDEISNGYVTSGDHAVDSSISNAYATAGESIMWNFGDAGSVTIGGGI